MKKSPIRSAKSVSDITDIHPLKRVESLFLDSGAHSLFLIARKNNTLDTFYESKVFWKYVDSYAAFVSKYKDGIDFYANVDAIHNPEMSWRVLKYLEEKHGLNPVPVIHRGTPLSWITKHLEAGYDYIGLGGLGQVSRIKDYYKWGDQVYNLLCDNPKRLPCVKTHGFAMTSYQLLIRYPWWSTDSASWVKCAAYGAIFVPHFRGGHFVYTESPYQIFVSHESPAVRKPNVMHYKRCTPEEKKIICRWLDQIGVSLGEKEWGVVSEHSARKVANIRFYDWVCKSLPEWPWPFYSKSCKKGLLY